MPKISLKPTHKAVVEFYSALENFQKLDVKHELAIKTPFQNLLDSAAKQLNWTLVPEYAYKKKRVDAGIVDEYNLPRGYWEAKDSADDLQKEIKKKFAAGYPTDNIIFQTPTRAILYQNKQIADDADLTRPEELIRIIEKFFDYTEPAFEEWGAAASDFRERIAVYGKALLELIEKERKTNRRFQTAFADFYELARASINPNLSEGAIEKMLIQHLLTERIFRTVFRNPDFTRRNIIAHEIEKVIDALTSQSFSRTDFLSRFDYFYRALEKAAETIDDWAQKQDFLNTVYERFFQSFDEKTADTHGIVYTPQSIVNFMVKSVEEILQKEFGKSLSSEGVHILDPFVGTGNFIVRVMQEIKRTALEHKFRHELHCNEVMLLPYYIASLNIEHEFYELTKSYIPFEGICLVDTFELAEHAQHSLGFMTAENTARVERQKKSPIFVCIGNPPYNAWQVNENDNNKNRKYKEMDKRVSETYAKDSNASLKNSLSDMYVKAIRWASDRIKQNEEGIVAFITNNSFIEKLAFDGVRQNLFQDFDELYIFDLGGDVRKNPKLSGTTHNVFGIQVGVSINILVRRKGEETKKARIFFNKTEEFWRKEEKYKLLDSLTHKGNVEWKELQPDNKHTWITEGLSADFDSFISLGIKKGKPANKEPETIFGTYSLGVASKRDSIAFNFNSEELSKTVQSFIETYNLELLRYIRAGRPKDVDNFVDYTKLKWSMGLKNQLERGKEAVFDSSKLRQTVYRPFTAKYLYFDKMIVDVSGFQNSFFPSVETEQENFIIYVSDKGFRAPFSALATNKIADSHLCATTDSFQSFPFYVYSEDGANRRENITDWALRKFREHYAKQSVPGAVATGLNANTNPVATAPGTDPMRESRQITKRDIFHYVYAVLHHPVYRAKYAANLKRELPRVPLAPDFWAFADAGERLAALHVNYESQTPFALEQIENREAEFSLRVEKMRLSKNKTELRYNDFLTLRNIPPEVYEYRLGNRSALEWIVEQYQVSTDARSGITNDPNRADDPNYILRLIGQIVAVSLETVKTVKEIEKFKLSD
ncbi:MAG TPA: type ISP restriction/modification enzyme [Pyrinomonadaceae bacterium]|jgi:predicted helicase